MKRMLLTALVVGLVFVSIPATAQDSPIRLHAAGNRFIPGDLNVPGHPELDVIEMEKGLTLVFVNLDFQLEGNASVHRVVSTTKVDGEYIFDSGDAGGHFANWGDPKQVDGTSKLAKKSYTFRCKYHSSMTGTLKVV
jgi:hypothetical protein